MKLSKLLAAFAWINVFAFFWLSIFSEKIISLRETSTIPTTTLIIFIAIACVASLIQGHKNVDR